MSAAAALEPAPSGIFDHSVGTNASTKCPFCEQMVATHKFWKFTPSSKDKQEEEEEEEEANEKKKDATGGDDGAAEKTANSGGGADDTTTSGYHGVVISAPECFCPIRVETLQFDAEVTIGVFNPPADATAMCLQALTDDWALVLHSTYFTMQHLTVASYNGFLGITGGRTSTAAEERENEDGTNDDEDDDFYSMPHISSVQLLMVPPLDPKQTSQEHQLNGIGAIFPRLRRLVLSDCEDLSDDALEPLGKTLLLLSYLDISGCSHVTDKGIGHLASLQVLRILCVSECAGITSPAGFELIANQCQFLRELVANSTSFNDAAFRAVASKLQLHRLDIADTKITPAALTSVVGDVAIVMAKTLTSLDISRCAIDNNECDGLIQFPKLAHVNFSRTSVDPGVVCNLAVLPGLQSVNLSNVNSVGDEDLAALETAQHLKNLVLNWCDAITDEGVEIIADCPSLERLELNGCVRITDAAIASLAENEDLRERLLGLSVVACCRVTDASAASIARFSKLEELNVARCGELTDAFLKNIAKAPSSSKRLKFLSIEHSKCSDDGIKEFLPQQEAGLVRLELSGCTQISVLGLLTCLTANVVVVVATAAAAGSARKKTIVSSLSFLFLGECPELADQREMISEELTKLNPGICIRF